MKISKTQGEKLDDKYMKIIYGSSGCGGNCGNCDCTKSNGEKFYEAYNPEMDLWEGVLIIEPEQ